MGLAFGDTMSGAGIGVDQKFATIFIQAASFAAGRSSISGPLLSALRSLTAFCFLISSRSLRPRMKALGY
jgi:hypothetical protein